MVMGCWQFVIVY